MGWTCFGEDCFIVELRCLNNAYYITYLLENASIRDISPSGSLRL